MQKKLIFLLVFMVLVAIFALQNSVEVELKLWFWSIRTSMVLILILTFAAGAVAGILFSLPGRSKESKKKVAEHAGEAPETLQEEEKSAAGNDEFEDIRI